MDLDRLRKIVDDIQDLPTLPTIASTVTRLVAAEDSTATDIAGMIGNDQSLTAKILKIANSAFYGLPKDVRTLRAAIVLLGFNSIKNIVLAASVFEAFYGQGSTGQLDRAALWTHSVACAAASKVIAARQQVADSEEVFFAGLMHDLGKVILDHYVHDAFAEVIQLARQRKCLLLEAERELLGVSHAEVGYWLADRWQLPIYLGQAMGFHHLPMDCPDFPDYACTVHVADMLVRTLKFGNGGDDYVPTLDQQAWDRLQMQTSELRDVAKETKQELDKASAFLALLE